MVEVAVVVAGDRGKKAERKISTGGFLTDTPTQWLSVVRFRFTWIIHGERSRENVNPNWLKREINLMECVWTFCKAQSIVTKKFRGGQSEHVYRRVPSKIKLTMKVDFSRPQTVCLRCVCIQVAFANVRNVYWEGLNTYVVLDYGGKFQAATNGAVTRRYLGESIPTAVE